VLSDINVTPLVDVMLVLLIIFIITVPVAFEGAQGQSSKGQQLCPRQTKPEDVTNRGRQIRSHLLECGGCSPIRLRCWPNCGRLRKFSRSRKSIFAATAKRATCYVGQVLVAAQKIGIRKGGIPDPPPLHPGEAP